MTSHESHHHHASALLKSPDGGKGARIIQIGLLCNLGLALIKLAGGWMLNSKALTADAWHSFSDLTTDILALVAVAVSSFSQSHTKISATTTARVERLLAIMAAGLLMTTAVHLGWDAVSSIRDQMMGQSALSDVKPSIQAVWPAILTVVVKESLYHATIRVANEIKSPVLASSAVHQRADSLLSVVTVIAIISSTIFASTAWIDSIGGLCISALVVRAALATCQDSFGNLV